MGGVGAKIASGQSGRGVGRFGDSAPYHLPCCQMSKYRTGYIVPMGSTNSKFDQLELYQISTKKEG